MSKRTYCIPCMSYRHGGRSKTCPCECHGEKVIKGDSTVRVGSTPTAEGSSAPGGGSRFDS